jgi:hypothetical protein
MSAPALQTKPAPMARYDAMCRAIEAAYKVDEVKDIRDQAIALETYARQAHNVEAERQACEIRLRAERKAGKLSAKLEKKPGKRTDKQPVGMIPTGSKKDELHKAGVSQDQAKYWERLAAVPDQEFEAALADRTAKPTTNGIIRANMAPKRNPVSDMALWLWGTLRDFERDGFLAKDPGEVLSTATPTMLDDVHVLAPRVVAWLKRIERNCHDLGNPSTDGDCREDHRDASRSAQNPSELGCDGGADRDRSRQNFGAARLPWLSP